MGGGGAMRAAAKVAGIGVISNGIRSTGSIENPVNVVVRPALSGFSSSGLTVEHQVQKPALEIDDWEFAGSESDEFVVDRNHSGNSRMVFGPVPTIEETKEATSELKDALDKVYLSSPKSAGSMESVSAHYETKSCVTRESSVPKSAMQAFRLLNESSAAQTVVASIACDPNVWNAVMQNPALVEYFESEKKSTIFESHDQESSNNSVDSADSTDSKKPDGLIDFLKNMKITVVDMVQNLTSMVQSWFAAPEAGKTAESTDRSTGSISVGGSLMGLAMMVIMVVVMKRA